MSNHHFSVGKIKLIVLNDGFELINEEVVINLVKPLPDAFLQAFRERPQADHSYNVLFIESDGERILFDAGIGAEGQPHFGHLLELLKQEGITPDQIDKVILSHLHLDHVGGLMVDGKAVFPNAEIFMPKLEWEHWIESGQAPAERTQLLKTIFAPYVERLHYFEDGDSPIDAITAIALPGHTPGHCGFLIESDGERVVHVVDALHLHTQITFPEVSPIFDLQPDISARTRRMILGRIADEGLTMLTYHLSFPGIGQVEREGTGFAWKPVG